MKPDPYASVERIIRLPYTHKLSEEIKIFKHLPKENKNSQHALTEPLLNKTNDLLDELNETFEVYQEPKTFEFAFPDSLFPPVDPNERNKIRYEQKMIVEQENTFKNRLSQEQLKEIQETGEFKVKSNIEYITLPYVWQINLNLFWGKNKIKKVWMTALSKIYGFFWSAKELISTQVPKQVALIKSIPYSLFKLFFGKKSIQTVISVDYERELAKDFWNKIMKELYEQSDEWCSALWNHFYIYFDPQVSRPVEYIDDPGQYNRRQAKHNKICQQYQKAKQAANEKERAIQAVEYNFNQEWSKMRKKLILQISEEINASNISFDHKNQSEEELLIDEQKEDGLNGNDQKILQKLAERKFTLFTEHLRTELPKRQVPVGAINALIFMLRLFAVISDKENLLQKEKSKRKNKIEEKIKNQHEIKSLFWPFFNRLVEQQMEPISKSLTEDMYKSFLEDHQFTKLLNKRQLDAFKEFLKFRLNKNTLLEAKKIQVPEYHGPTRIFYSNYNLLPPYKVIKEGDYYSLKKVSDFITVDTSVNCWKFQLYWMRVKTWTINCLVFLCFSVWKGPIGLRCLWGIQDFPYDQDIDYQTGQIYNRNNRTVLGTFKKVMEGIQNSRREFEETPDLGLLGKNVSRIFNYIQCYAFRFLFVGIILVLIGFPILIVAASAVTITLVVTVWAWMPLILIVTYLFNILFKQFETAKEQYGFFSRSFPLFRILLRFIVCIITIILTILNLIILAPLKAFFALLYSMVQNLFRKGLDGFMMFIFKHLGRTPSRDTPIAKKISGPGMTKQFYMSINEEDVYILVRACLQRKFMYKLNELINQKITKQGGIFRNVLQKVLQPFGAYYNKEDKVSENMNYLLQNYQRQYNVYMNRYPNNPYNVRFTQDQIDSYFPNTLRIVQNFVDKFQINGWIFEQHELYEGMYDQLTRCIWIEIFGCGQEIFEPLQKLDARFKLEDQYKNEDDFSKKMKKGVGSVMKALEGQVQFSHHHKKLSPFKHNLLSRQKSIQQISYILELRRQNCLESVNLSQYNIRTLFVPNLNIKELIIVSDQTRLRNIKNQQNIIDL